MSDSNRAVGRPTGRIKTSKIEITIEPQIKEEFMLILQAEGKKASTEIGLWIRDYIKKYKKEGAQL